MYVVIIRLSFEINVCKTMATMNEICSIIVPLDVAHSPLTDACMARRVVVKFEWKIVAGRMNRLRKLATWRFNMSRLAHGLNRDKNRVLTLTLIHY